MKTQTAKNVMRMRFSIVALACACCACKTTLSDFKMPYPKAAQLHGAWVGFANGEVFLYRVDLTDRGGLFAQEYRQRDITLYPIKEWSISKYTLSLKMKR